jgi:hypothetical protein
VIAGIVAYLITGMQRPQDGPQVATASVVPSRSLDVASDDSDDDFE